MIVYKVVNNVDGQLFSAVVVNPIVRLEYKINEWTESKFGPIYCFPNEDDAYRFLRMESRHDNNLQLWKCFVNTKDERCLKEYSDLVFRNIDKKNNFDFLSYFKKLKNIIRIPCYGYPKGTVAFKRIKLLERVG